jgi:hypothetical protein
MSEHRQKILLGILGIMLLYFGGEWAWRHAVQGPLDLRRSRADRLQNELEKREKELARARAAVKDLAAFEEQSLPSDPQVARSLYRAWLLQLVTKVGFVNRNVEAGEPVGRRGLFQSITFTVQGRGTLGQLTRFLYEFYRAGHLHQVRSLAITPLSNPGQLDLSLVIEALVLPLAEEKDQLSQSVSDRLAWEKFEDYAAIPRRNLFGSTGTSDPTDHAFVTAIQYVNGRPEVWLTLRTEDKVVKLKPGESFQVGQFAGKVIEIEGDDVVLEEADGQRWLVSFGESLAQAFALPGEY